MSAEPGKPNPYRPPQADLEPAPAGAPGGADFSRDDVLAYCGHKRGASFWNAWQKQGDRLLGSFNGAAFLFNFAWFAYRKMYKEAVALFVILTLEGTVVGFLFDDSSQLGTSIDRGARIGISVTTAMLANGLYRRRVKAAIARVAATNPPSTEARHQLLAKMGGTSLLAALVAAAVVVALAVALVFGNS
jgi:hypothetical protein